MIKKLSALLLTVCIAGVTAAGCGNPSGSSANQTTQPPETKPVVTELSKLDMGKWKLNENTNMYYQAEIDYCEKPADEKYEKLAVFVPAAFMDGSDNGDGTYTCELNEKKLNGYSASDAPIVMPIETEGYYAATAMTDEFLGQNQGLIEMISEYTSKGFVFVHAGCRGVEEGAPTGVTDLKAAIRYVRYCDDVLPGDSENIFVDGMSGGGAQSVLLGACGNSELYEPYLKAIGAIQGVSDAVAGSMSWCPITSLDTADAEYEWMLGCSRTDRTAEEQEVTDRLSKAFADYLNKAGFVDENGKTLSLEESKEDIYQAGSYYDYIKSVIEKSLTNFLSDNKYTDTKAQEYIDSLNTDSKWASYDKSTHTASITSVADFVKARKNAFPYYVGFDNPPGNNTLFGYGDGKGSHFDRILADILTDMNSEYAAAYNADLEKTDSFGNTVEQRVDMYSPLYFLMDTREGYKKADVAKYWRIRSGIEQPTTSLTTEVNLALALNHYDGVKSVDFETVWEQSHTEAERTDDPTSNFIAWVNSCVKG